ncbi:hypothetical protein EW145_g2983 [Phellinidium pouzarii]|uniref:DUF2433 domain-containing protein n=1 Tax=Phellinidium pouzarii TaxID=167371 RepID=A0A4S4L997_9AGAM|nr:hypothetical protein EW145_g2983 [Phellinidium pouzarii]
MQSAPRTATSSTRPGSSPLPRTQPPQVNTQTKVIDTIAGRILCIADVRGRLSSLNDMAREVGAKAIIHTGDFGFFESSSLERINDRTLKHLTQYSPLIPNAQRGSLLAPETPPALIRAAMTISLLSEFPLLLSGQIKLSIPVYTVWGACEDVVVLEKFRQGTYDIENLHVIDEAVTRCLDVGGVKLRLLGLGGAFVPHKMFDNGDGNATIAGGQGTMWTTALQIGELVDTAQRVYDPTETRLLVTHASPGREGIIAQLALVLKADLTISAGLHFRYTSSWNEFSVQGDFEGFRHKIITGKEGFDKIWESVKPQVEAVVDDNQRILLEKALSVIERVPVVQPHIGPGGTATGDEPAWKNCWNWNLCDAAYGSLVLDIKEGRVKRTYSTKGFNYAYRRTANTTTPNSFTSALPNNAVAPPSPGGTPAPQKIQPLAPRSNGPSIAPTPPPQLPKQQQQQSAVNSGRETPKDAQALKVNGNATASSPDTKDKEALQSDEVVPFSEVKPNAAQSSTPPSGKATPVMGAPSEANDKGNWNAGPMSPVGGNEKSDVKEFFGDARDGIVRIHFPQNYNKATRTAFVEFGDEEAMKMGLEKHAEKMKDIVPYVVQADDRESNPSGGVPWPRPR